ncbi:hypothetical protein GGR57DRAFT_502382 [Xylariaceae sp. FL1272]|nr:hypothetical protein GGR57DRAFT_502382 [Xylariaceae sp. FL1272]
MPHVQETPAALCTQCNSACYCCNGCQRADWSVHKTMCKTFASFDMSTRPSNDHILGVRFPEKEKPKLVWVHCPLEDIEDGCEDPKFYDQVLKFHDHSRWLQTLGREAPLRNAVGIFCRQTFTFDGSLPNRNIEALKAANPRQAGTTRWAGPVLGYAMTWRMIPDGREPHKDVDMKDFRHIADSLIVHPNDRI